MADVGDGQVDTHGYADMLEITGEKNLSTSSGAVRIISQRVLVWETLSLHL